jgi:hypothetical protein
MKGDFSRLNHNPSNHYVGVLHQQGRVFLDSDWNEDVLERLAMLRQELNDVIGQCGVPEPGTAFQISPGLDPTDFHIAGGRCYVNGNLCRLENDTTYLSQPDLLDPPPINVPPPGATEFCLVYLEVWHRLITYLEDESLREIALNGPDTATRLKTIAQVKIVTLPSSVTDFGIANILQFLPASGAGTLSTLQPVPPPKPFLSRTDSRSRGGDRRGSQHKSRGKRNCRSDDSTAGKRSEFESDCLGEPYWNRHSLR